MPSAHGLLGIICGLSPNENRIHSWNPWSWGTEDVALYQVRLWVFLLLMSSGFPRVSPSYVKIIRMETRILCRQYLCFMTELQPFPLHLGSCLGDSQISLFFPAAESTFARAATMNIFGKSEQLADSCISAQLIVGRRWDTTSIRTSLWTDMLLILQRLDNLLIL